MGSEGWVWEGNPLPNRGMVVLKAHRIKNIWRSERFFTDFVKFTTPTRYLLYLNRSILLDRHNRDNMAWTQKYNRDNMGDTIRITCAAVDCGQKHNHN